MNENALRKDLIELLRGGQAHVNLKQALESINQNHRYTRPQAGKASIYELLEHMHLAQEDILRYTLDKNWVSPPFPDGYWPAKNMKPRETGWERCVDAFFSDLDEMIAFVRETELDLTSQIPHGEGRTYLREILLVADHNAYHLGQILQLYKQLLNQEG